jgi:hypothetical protein
VQTIVYPILSLLYLSPLFLLFSDVTDLGILLLALALALILTGPTIPPREAQFFGKVIWPALAFAAFPAAFMIFQILPLPTFAHPAWQSTAGALASPLSGSISLDKGATLLAFCRFCAFGAAVLLSVAGGINRNRAERILVAALVAATAVAALHVLAKPGSFPIGASVARARLHESGDMVFIACFGLFLSLAFAGLAYNAELQRPKDERKPDRGIPKWSLSLVSAMICVLALWRSWSVPTVVAVCAGLITIGLIIIARRLGLLVGGVLAATALIVSMVLIGNNLGRADVDITLRFAGGDTAKLETLQRMVQDQPVFGTGAGTFVSLHQLYRSVEEGPSTEINVPFGAVISIEMGRIFLWTSFSLLVLGAAFLCRAAIRRGRDWIYPATAAASLVTALVLAFVTPIVAGPVLLLVGATILGLGLAQSRSRTAQ